ncbi:MAG: 2-oxoacid:ferredoxin oxidoreductase subunit beta [Anaerolineae bacterium]|nr:2-oxoacid:ferredoxin oxidoreductase subunit beta [Anaerolineae bacterium]
MEDLGTYAENTWCPGCGNFAILNAFKAAIGRLEEQGIGRDRIVLVAGIGQHGKIFDYMNVSGFYGLHGRSMASAQAIKLANPDLKVVDFVGDGDALGEGLEHTIFAAKRNADITMILHDNGVYALTTGQYTPTSARGYRGPSTPTGTVEDPIHPLPLMLEAGASFIARGYSGELEHLTDLMVQAVLHEGFSFVDVLQPCVTFNNTWREYNQLVEITDRTATTPEEARAIFSRTDRLPIGVLYRRDDVPFHRRLYEDFNPVRDKEPREARQRRVAQFLGVPEEPEREYKGPRERP